jgi:mRNA-degrading endonuclease toxin of MazEF toxin-antitoxin module
MFNAYAGDIFEVQFGENIGNEFSGTHLALCLKDSRVSDSMITVIPISTQYESYNLKHSIDVASYIDGKRIKGGIVLGEAKSISKLRINPCSGILDESSEDKVFCVGHYNITEEEIRIFSEV